MKRVYIWKDYPKEKPTEVREYIVQFKGYEISSLFWTGEEKGDWRYVTKWTSFPIPESK